MSLSCDCYSDEGFESFWMDHSDMRARYIMPRKRCCSCNSLINLGEECIAFYRYRYPRNYIEEAIHGEFVSLANWFMCEICSGLVLAVEELGLCYDIWEPIKEQIAEYREIERYEAT